MRILPTLLILALLCPSLTLAQEPPPSKVVVAQVTQEEIAENRSFLGFLSYERISHISSETSGLVEMIRIKEGQRVTKGDTLVRLKTDMLDKEITLAQTRIQQMDLRIEHALKNLKRLEKLFKESGVSERDYDDAMYNHQDLLKEKQAMENELAMLLLRQEKSVIKAPFTGVILEKNVDLGDWLQQGETLASLASVADLFVRVPVSESLVQYVHKGDRLNLTINAFGSELTGTLESFDPQADPQTKNVFLKIRIPDQPQAVENMSVTVFVPTSKARQLAILPRDALIKFQGQDFVYTVKEGKAAILPANIVTYLGNRVGVDNPYFVAGMPVVIEGNERLQPDQPVMVAGEK